jgi:hypothetical protein
MYVSLRFGREITVCRRATVWPADLAKPVDAAMIMAHKGRSAPFPMADRPWSPQYAVRGTVHPIGMSVAEIRNSSVLQLADCLASLSMENIDIALKEAMAIEGALGVALVDVGSGMALGTLGGGKDLDLGVGAAGNTDMVRAKLRVMEMLGVTGSIEDILTTLSTQYHLVRLLTARSGAGLFLYLVLDRGRSNLALARRQLQLVEAGLEA